MSGASPPTIAMQSAPGNTVALGVLDPPPEGYKGIAIPIMLSSGVEFSAFYQLNAQSGLLMSQVQTICLDNTANSAPVTITHGAFSENFTVPPYTYSVFPTFTAVNGSFSVFINCEQNANIVLTLLNYVRQSSSSNTGSNGNSGLLLTYSLSGQPSFAAVNNATSFPSTINLTPSGLIILDSLDMAIEQVTAKASGPYAIDVVLITLDGLPSASIAEMYVTGNAASAGEIANPCAPIYRTWTNGLNCAQGNPSGTILQLIIGDAVAVNVSSITIRTNFSGRLG